MVHEFVASLTIGGAVRTPMTLTLADLEALPAISVTVDVRTGHGPHGIHGYRGVLLKDLLDWAMIVTDPNREGDNLSRFIVATGSDGYRVTVAYGEIDPDFGNKRILVAYAMDDAPLAADGPFALVIPEDRLAGRSVKRLVSLIIGVPT